MHSLISCYVFLSILKKHFIKLSDNGVGYGKDMLDKLNCEESDLYEDYHVGITNLKKRIELIYGTNYYITFYNEPAGGACTLIYLPLEDTI